MWSGHEEVIFQVVHGAVDDVLGGIERVIGTIILGTGRRKG